MAAIALRHQHKQQVTAVRNDKGGANLHIKDGTVTDVDNGE
ncbi:hypothetical protein [Streptomyces malaysiensis]|nr:hypothetical protein R8789_16775 [Streptomyces malaysiensis]